MRPEETAWLQAALNDYPAEEISPLLEIGSSTLRFRTITKPHIETALHAPLRNRGVEIITTDMKPDPGVTIAGNIYDPKVQARLRALKPRSILNCNTFEHVADPAGFASICDSILSPRGLAVITAPYSYPYHLDPIDTMFRPSPEEVAALFRGYEILRSEIIPSGWFVGDLVAAHGYPGAAGAMVKDAFKALVLRGGIEASKARAHRYLWLFRSYRETCVLLRKPG